MLIGYGLISLWRTKPGEAAPGAQTVYRAADIAIEAKQHVEQWGADRRRCHFASSRCRRTKQ